MGNFLTAHLRIFFVVAFTAPPLFAGWRGSSGEAAFDHFQESAPASVRAVGGVGIAHFTGPESWFLQPAALSPDSLSLLVSFSSDGFGGKSGVASALYRIDSLQFGVAVAGSDLGSVAGRDSDDRPTGVAHTPRSALISSGLSLRHNGWEWGYRLGLASDRISQEEESALAWWVDVGVRKVLSRRAVIAATMRRLGWRINSYTIDGDPRGELPAEAIVGGSFLLDPKGRWSGLLDLIVPAFGAPSAALGVEWRPIPLLQLRTGSRIDLDQLLWLTNQIGGDGKREWQPQQLELWSAGVGFTPGQWGLDYSITLLRDGAGLQHALQFRWFR